MTIQELLELLESDGWARVEEADQCIQLKHDSKSGLVTVSGSLDLNIPPGVVRSLRRHVQIEENG